MSAETPVVIDLGKGCRFFVTRQEVIKHGALIVASNRLRGSRKNPTIEEIQQLADKIESTFSESRKFISTSVS